MTITMNDSHIKTLEQLREALRSVARLTFKGLARQDKYAWVAKTLKRFRYRSLPKKDRGVVRTYLQYMTGLSRAQTTRLLTVWMMRGSLRIQPAPRHRFSSTYTLADKLLLLETDNAHQRLSGPATRRLFQRQFNVYGDKRFVRLQHISSAHIYNLRGSKDYKRRAQTFAGTKAVHVPIGVRRRPDPHGQPGWIRVDTVHQGDQDKTKGVYHINLVDAVTQWEVVVCVQAISERFLLPALKEALASFPFVLQGFHSDNGSEFINGVVAQLLNKLLIEQTKSRSGRTNDNALVEGKNGSIIRKHMGYGHIEQRHAQAINAFYRDFFVPYLNFHRPCGFATLSVDRKGKRRRKYKTYQTPYEKLRSLEKLQLVKKADTFLRPGVTLASLDALAKALSDNQAAETMQQQKHKLFASFHIRVNTSQNKNELRKGA
jgi:transposase InsO family protein